MHESVFNARIHDEFILLRVIRQKCHSILGFQPSIKSLLLRRSCRDLAQCFEYVSHVFLDHDPTRSVMILNWEVAASFSVVSIVRGCRRRRGRGWMGTAIYQTGVLG